jgi:hypothetical protein
VPARSLDVTPWQRVTVSSAHPIGEKEILENREPEASLVRLVNVRRETDRKRQVSRKSNERLEANMYLSCMSCEHQIEAQGCRAFRPANSLLAYPMLM